MHFDCPYLNTHVELTGEREAHIQEKHPDLLPVHRDYVSETVRDPDEVRRDPRGKHSLLFSHWFLTSKKVNLLLWSSLPIPLPPIATG